MAKTLSVLSLSLAALIALQCSALAEEKAESKYKFKLEKVKTQHAVAIRFKVAPTDPKAISAKYGESFTALFGYVIQNGGQPAGQPYGRYHAFKPDALEIEAGIPVAKPMKGNDKIKAVKLPEGEVLTTIHQGPYEKLSEAHDAVQNHMANNKKYEAAGPVWEVYLTDPGNEPDQSKWQTKIYIPVKAKK